MFAEMIILAGCQSGQCPPVQSTPQAATATYVFTQPQIVRQSVTIKQRVRANGVFNGLFGRRICGNAAAGNVNTIINTRTYISNGCRGGLCR